MPSPVLKCSIRTGILTALALVLGAGAAAAQTGSIEGTVRNSQNASLIEGAQVTVVGTALTARSDGNGYYRIDNVPAGTYSVRVARLGYNPVTAANARVTPGLCMSRDYPASEDLCFLSVTHRVVPKEIFRSRWQPQRG